MQSIYQTRIKVCFFILCMAILVFNSAYAGNDGYGEERIDLGDVFADATQAATLDFQLEMGVKRFRYVNINFDALSFAQTNISGKYSIHLPLFPDVIYSAHIDQIFQNPSGSYSWIGSIPYIPESQVILIVKNNILSGNITMDGKFYQIRFAGNDVHTINEINQNKFPQELQPIPIDTKDNKQPTGITDDGSLIDVLVVYTGDARAAAGGTAAMESVIDLAVTESNTGYGNSGVNQRMNLVHTAEVVYSEAGFDWSTTLSRLAGTSDGYMDNVHTLRNTYGADEVCLIVNNTGYCGLAYLMTSVSTSFESAAFALVSRVCATGYYSFAHELGHNMGSHHDRANASGSGAYSYSYGYQEPAGAWRTIMAYNCPSSCTRLNYWSNPDVLYGGLPMGVVYTSPTSADNRMSLNNTAYTVANFRQSVAATQLPVFDGSDFNGGGSADIAVFRPSNGYWYIGGVGNYQWGASGDTPVNGNYNGGAADEIAVFRPSNGYWFIRGVGSYQWGTSGDVPVPGDYNNNNLTDIAVFRPSNGYWFIRGVGNYQWGASGDIVVPGDYNGDGADEIAVWRPSNGYWFIRGVGNYPYGTNGDIPVPGDYDGDGTTDRAVWRPSNGYWFIQYSGGGSGLFQFGTNGDTPVPGDYNGDGTTDIAVWRPSNGYWFVYGQFFVQWGTSSDIPLIR